MTFDTAPTGALADPVTVPDDPTQVAPAGGAEVVDLGDATTPVPPGSSGITDLGDATTPLAPGNGGVVDLGDATSPYDPDNQPASRNVDLGDATRPVPVVPEMEAVEQATAIGQSLAGTAVDTSGFMAGAGLGMRAGVVATAWIPIPGARVVGGLVGGGIGGGIGWYAGRGAREVMSKTDIPFTDTPITRMSVQDFPSHLRTAAVVGEVYGGGLPMTGAMLAGAKWVVKKGITYSGSFVANYFNSLLRGAAARPGVFVGAELSGMGGAAGGGALSQNLWPDEVLPRVGMEMAGGLINPPRLLYGFANIISATFKRVMQAAPGKVGQSFRMSKAAQILQEAVEESGGDPILLAKLIDAGGLSGVGKQTSAALTGNTVIAEIEAQLRHLNAKFSDEALALLDANLTNLDAMIRVFRSTGKPGDLKIAAEFQAQKFQMLIASRLQAAEREIIESVGDVTKMTAGDRMALSKKAVVIIEEVKTLARRAESAFWENIPNTDTIMIDAGAVMEEARLIMKKLAVTGAELPSEIKFFIDSLNAAGASGKKTLGEMIIFRSRLLELAGDAAGGSGRTSLSDASKYGRMAESVLDSLDDTFGPPGSPQQGLNRMLGLSADAYHTARSFSFKFNEVFTRTFAGQVLSKNARGASRVPMGLMLKRALAQGGDEGFLRLEELREATEFLKKSHLVPDVEADQYIADMIEHQANLFRIMATKFVAPVFDLKTGQTLERVRRTAMLKFMDENELLLKRFPAIHDVLKKAVKSEEAFQSILATGSLPGRAPVDATRIGRQQAAFADVAKLDNSVGAVKKAVNSANPERALGHLADLGKKGGFHAREGLRSSVIDNAMDNAMLGNGHLDFNSLRKQFFEPMQTGGTETLMDILQKSGIMDASDAKRLTTILDEADKLAGVASATGRVAEDALDQPVDMITDLLTRSAGAVVASAIAKHLGVGGSGPSLIIAAAGSRVAQRAMDKVPLTAIRDLLIQAALDPSFMAMLLRKPVTTAGKITLNLQMHAYLLQAGFIPLRGQESDLEEEFPLPMGP